MLLFTSGASAVDGFWSKAGGGSWANAANWDSGDIADGTDDSAYFGLLANVPANTAITLDGARTIGNLFFSDQTGADNWILNTGTGGPLTLDATFDLPSIAVAIAAQQVTMNAVLAGVDGLEKLGDGTLLLAATNSYTGPTLVSAGTLRVNGQIGSGGVTVASGSVGGTGTIKGPVTVESGGTLAPGNSIGTLTISNALTLQPGSTTRIEVNASTLARDAVQGLSNATYGGTLVVSNLAGTLGLGQSFSIFSAVPASGNFTNITPNPGSWLRWRFDPVIGILSVVSAASQPTITSITVAGTNVVVRVTNGPPSATAYLLSSTNVALPRTSWARVATNQFDVNGSSIFTNRVALGTPRVFCQISVSVGP